MKKLATAIWLLLVCAPAMAQLTTTPANNGQELAQYLAGPGVVISNVQFNCGDGAFGFFNGVNSNLGIDSGIVMSTGLISDIPGPNNGNISGWTNGPTLPYLTQLSGYNTFDGCELEFDVYVTSDTLVFTYVFGSDEYSEYVGSLVFNDIFAFFITGANPQGGTYNNLNVALVPGTNTPVSINNVNCVTPSYPQYYVCNDPVNSGWSGPWCNAAINPCPTDVAQTTVDFDGFTVPLIAKIAVQPCTQYHLKLAIADCSDSALDSGVFIEAGSLSSYGVFIQPQATYINPIYNAPTAVEGCVDAQVLVQLSFTPVDTVQIPLIIGGTAEFGVDYTYVGFVSDTLIFAPGVNTIIIDIEAIQDNISDPYETILFIYQPQFCASSAYDTAIIYITDFIEADIRPDTMICPGTPLQLSINGGDFINYNWIPNVALSCTDCQFPIASPTNTITYYGYIWAAQDSLSCSAMDSIVVSMSVDANAGPDIGICPGFTATLFGAGGAQYAWSPPDGLDATNTATVVASPDVTTTYYLVTTSPTGDCTDEDTVIVTVYPPVIGTVNPDTIICFGTEAQLSATGGTIYNWQPSHYVVDNTLATAVGIPYDSTTYTIFIFDDNGCVDTLTTFVDVYPDPGLQVSGPHYIYLGESVELSVVGGVSYVWTPVATLDISTIANPTATPGVTTIYQVSVTTAEGCIYTSDVTVFVAGETFLIAPNAFSPNGDGINDRFNFIVRGIFTLQNFSIFDRWGEVVFQTNNADLGWDGTFKGKPAELGVYVYQIRGLDVRQQPIMKYGNLLLLR